MPVVPIIAGVAAIAAVGGTIASISAQKKAAKQAKKANAFERQKANLQSARQKIEAVREGRRAYASAQQAAANQGVADSSSAQGGAGSILSQTDANLSFLDRFGYFSDQASRALQKSANYTAQAGMWGQVAQFGSEVFQATGGFKGPSPPTGK
jgi:hypothetical protein